MRRVAKNHPRIKYSVKHTSTPVQALSHSMPTIGMVQQPQLQPQQQTTAAPKLELLNYSLSRRFGQPRYQQQQTSWNASFEATDIDITKAAVASIVPIPNTAAIMQPHTVTQQQQQHQQIIPIKLEGQGIAKVVAISQDDIQTSIISEYSNYEIDDIELPDGTKIGFTETTVDSMDQSSEVVSYRNNPPVDGQEDEEDRKSKSMDMMYASDSNEDPNRQFECRHCGKKYRWKSTLRRHESVECGGKEPLHECPHCVYKAKQRGNLGVHIRKHHPDLPQLDSRRKNRSM